MLTTVIVSERNQPSNLVDDISLHQNNDNNDNIEDMEDNKKKKITEVIGTIQKENQIEFLVHEKNDSHDEEAISGSILISYNEKKSKFSFFNSKQQTLGSFTIKQLIKYIGNFVDSYEQFMRNVKLETSVYVINTFLCMIEYNNNNINITLYDHIKSPYMGNIELLIKLNNGLRDFQKNSLDIELNKVDKKYKKKIISAINQFIYMLLNHTQKIIAIACEKVNKDPSYETIREGLMKYSIASVYRISQFVKEQLKVHAENYEELTQYINKTNDLKLSLSHKMDKMNQLLEEQNNKINIIVEKIEDNNKNKLMDQAGGDDSDNSEDQDEDEINDFKISSDSNEKSSSPSPPKAEPKKSPKMSSPKLSSSKTPSRTPSNMSPSNTHKKSSKSTHSYEISEKNKDDDTDNYSFSESSKDDKK